MVNNPSALTTISNKREFRRRISGEKYCPPTFFDFHAAYDADQYPLVIRPNNHAGGESFYVAYDSNDLSNIWMDDHYATKLINKASEYRVFIANGRALCVAQKFCRDPEEIVWNASRNSYFENVNWDEWPLKAVKYAIEASNKTEIDFGAVDVIIDPERNVYVLEINSAPALPQVYRRECVAKAVKYFNDNGTERIPLVDRKGGYLKFIHPCINERAY